ncbi:hypothetical protein I7I53_10366 [Histoplasma capsulatum var. duboisii H88]|uniref:Uncharacterized protein n=1 Tax=Ajellomyces capsulatus (strain H88) TaxID=544711 RepID=A0A8A1LBQ3_AJEC8|nr:hypothetical protein I7I53_10366 [Histoplasma capsulatum var. duboisii H88]
MGKCLLPFDPCARFTLRNGSCLASVTRPHHTDCQRRIMMMMMAVAGDDEIHRRLTRGEMWLHNNIVRK